ncbi:MAG TPA: primase-like DNA-binding domain-containing protein [Methanoregula sp.]|nr:primase-like DNA-binding domain-containing protein [Methanoregula sp.]
MTGPGWQQVTVQLRSDIVAAAEKKRLDINDECNRVLAVRLGIVYPSLPRAPSPQTSRVIVAPDAAAKPPGAVAADPVINAEDPTVPGKVLREKKEKKAAAAQKPPVLAKTTAPAPPAAVPAKPAPKTRAKGRKGDPIQRFVSTRLVREAEEGPDAIIAKDDLYQRFERWCRDQDYPAVPERRVFSVALKNKYAFAERIVGGTPSWVSIRVK